MDGSSQMAKMLEEQFPDLSPNERFVEWRKMNLELIEAGILAAILKSDGDVLYKHVEHCSNKELQIAMSAAQYRNWAGLDLI